MPPPSAENLAKANSILGELFHRGLLFPGEHPESGEVTAAQTIAAALDAVRAEERAKAEAVVQAVRDLLVVLTDPGAYSAEDQTTDMRAALDAWETRNRPGGGSKPLPKAGQEDVRPGEVDPA